MYRNELKDALASRASAMEGSKQCMLPAHVVMAQMNGGGGLANYDPAKDDMGECLGWTRMKFHLLQIYKLKKLNI